MVMSHAGLPIELRAYISMFHMPLFFICSGYCFKDKYIGCFLEYVVKRIKGLYVPFVKWGILFLLLHNVFYKIGFYNSCYGFLGNVTHLYTWKEYIVHCIEVVLLVDSKEMLLGGYWFLHTMFFASFIAYCFFRYIEINMLSVGISLIISWLCLLFCFSIPYINIGYKEFLAATMILLGKEVKKYDIKQGWLFIVICFFIVLVASIIIPRTMASVGVISIIPYVLVSIIGSIMIFSISAKLTGKFKSIMIYIGNHTLALLTWHFLSFKLASMFIIYIEDRPAEQLAYFPVIPPIDCVDQLYSNWWVLYFLVGMLIPLTCCYVKERFV